MHRDKYDQTWLRLLPPAIERARRKGQRELAEYFEEAHARVLARTTTKETVPQT